MPAPSPAAQSATADLLSAAALLAPLEGGEWSYHETGPYRSLTRCRHDGEVTLRVQCAHVPESFERFGQWYGAESRRDTAGRLWMRHVHMVIDDFGDLVEVAA